MLFFWFKTFHLIKQKFAYYDGELRKILLQQTCLRRKKFLEKYCFCTLIVWRQKNNKFFKTFSKLDKIQSWQSKNLMSGCSCSIVVDKIEKFFFVFHGQDNRNMTSHHVKTSCLFDLGFFFWFFFSLLASQILLTLHSSNSLNFDWTSYIGVNCKRKGI